MDGPDGKPDGGSGLHRSKRTTQPIQFFEGPTFDATTNANDGVVLVALSDGGAGRIRCAGHTTQPERSA